MARSTLISSSHPRSGRSRLALPPSLVAVLVAAHGGASAQPPGAAPPAAAASAARPAELAPVTVTGRAAPVASVSGWGDTPLAATPLQATVLSAAALRDAGATRLADVTTLDPGVSDAYNAEGYVDFLTVRGYVLDNRFNFRRDGLPINAETSIPLENKAAVEILKGTSGLQSGTSAPGGLVNYVVKRPGDTPVRSVFLEWRQPGTVTGAVDLGQRFGIDGAFGVRLNAAAAHLDPQVRSSTGDRQLFALAADWRLGRDSLLEAEVETSHRSQPSQPGFSLLGGRVPSASTIDPRTNLNDQPWSQPVVFDATTASLRWQQRLAGDWRLVVHGATQRLRNDDRLAYPYGCSKEKNEDRYCSDGSFDLYDFRSENERRRTDALDVSVEGKARTGGLAHTLRVGVLQSRVKNRFEGQTYNYVGTGNVDGTAVTPDDPTPGDTNTNRDEHSTELHVQDAIDFGHGLTAWVGARTTRLHRQSVRTDGSAASDYAETFTTPSVALSYALAPAQTLYASWGRGVESNVVASNPRYSNAGAVFTAKSRQVELGIKGASEAWEWNAAAFDIRRPRTADYADCSDPAACVTVTTRPDGSDRHRGVEADAGWRSGPWLLRGGVQLLRARVEGSTDATVDGKRPTNVPARTVKAQASRDLAAVPGLAVQANVVHESRREVLPDNSISIPGWTRVDAGLRYEAHVGGRLATWRAGVDNVFDRRAWRESPYQYSHVYLYPLARRTFRVSLQIDL